MRLVYGFFAFLLWSGMYGLMVKHGLSDGFSDNAALIAMAIVVAGAMAGGN